MLVESVKKLIGTGLLVSVITLPSAAMAGNLSGRTTGTFSNPNKVGFAIEPDGTQTFFDNTLTAVVNNPSPSELTWGDIPQSSSLSFTPSSYAVSGDEEFSLGTISFFNGTSQLYTLIFGEDLTLDSGNEVTQLVLNLGITTTRNSIVDPAFDADFITFSGLPSPLTLHAFEGSTVQAELFGHIVGDPIIELTRIVLSPGQEVNGFISDGPVAAPFAPVPEPSNVLGFLAIGAFGLAGLIKRTISA